MLVPIVFGGNAYAWALPRRAAEYNTCVVFATQVLYYSPVDSKQFKRWLAKQGATFQQGKGSHLKVYLNDKQSVLPMHGKAEIGKGLESAIKKQLGLK